MISKLFPRKYSRKQVLELMTRSHNAGYARGIDRLDDLVEAAHRGGFEEGLDAAVGAVHTFKRWHEDTHGVTEWPNAWGVD